MTDAIIELWGTEIGAVSWNEEQGVGVFQYMPSFLRSGIELSPLFMPLAEAPYMFLDHRNDSFNGLPGMLADSLPDTFGNQVLESWLASQGRDKKSLNPVERLCYIGTRGMGALEFHPTLLMENNGNPVDVANLVGLANMVLNSRESLEGQFTNSNDEEEMLKILRVGSSAGGARAKAILAWNPETNEFRSGQVNNSSGYEYWILKFDGISNNRDKEVNDPEGYGLIEYVYYLMASKAGVIMSDCRLHKESGRSHFMTRRFDRTIIGDKLHMQSFAALAHLDFNMSGAASYELLFLTMRQLGLSQVEIDQQFVRILFNVIARNQDDHVKNFAFLMNRDGEWSLSPAYDVTYSYNPSGKWTSQHQMTINGKRRNFIIDDFYALGDVADVKKSKVKQYIDQCNQAVSLWPGLASNETIDSVRIQAIQSTHRLNILP